MEIGIFAHTFDGDHVEQLLDAAAAHGLRCVHFNLKCAGVPTLPETIDTAFCHSICDAFERRGMKMVALSATFNAVDPDQRLRRQQTRRAAELLRGCRLLGTGVMSLRTGTRDPLDMWRYRPENSSPTAWNDLVDTLEQLLPVADAVLWDEDWRDGESLLDADPKAGGTVKKLLGIDEDYYVAVPPDPTDEEMKGIWTTLSGLARGPRDTSPRP